MSQDNQPTILLIEPDASLRRLVALGLQVRGVQVIEARKLAEVSAADVQRLDLLVLDIDSSARRDWSQLEVVCSHPVVSALPIVVLAWEENLGGVQRMPSSIATLAPERVTCLAKPFDARILQRTVEQLLAVQASQEAARERQAEEVLLASYSRQAAPSPWPILTAAGLLLAVIGMIFQIFVAAAGFLIAIVALLLWTLGTGATGPNHTPARLSPSTTL